MKLDVLILGSGPAGLAAALYLGRSGRAVAVLEGTPGGMLSSISQIENYPGVSGSISGADLSETMKNQAVMFGARFFSGMADKITKDGDIYRTTTLSNESFESRAVIIATGASPRKLCVPGEDEFIGKGVSFCATCDGNFYRGMDVIVVGGGNSALSEALHLAHLAKSVVIVYRQDEFKRAEKILIDRVNAAENISVRFNAEIAEILGGQFVERVILKDGGEIKTDGVFMAIGHTPNTAFLGDDFPLDGAGYIITIPNRAQVAGHNVFVAGDVRSETKKQVVVAAGLGATAAMEADEVLG